MALPTPKEISELLKHVKREAESDGKIPARALDTFTTDELRNWIRAITIPPGSIDNLEYFFDEFIDVAKYKLCSINEERLQYMAKHIFAVCDYLFTNKDVQEVETRIKELLDFSIRRHGHVLYGWRHFASVWRSFDHLRSFWIFHGDRATRPFVDKRKTSVSKLKRYLIRVYRFLKKREGEAPTRSIHSSHYVKISPGDKFGNWTVIKEVRREKDNIRMCQCRCDCGHILNIVIYRLTIRNASRCVRCFARYRKDFTYGKKKKASEMIKVPREIKLGDTFGRWVVLSEDKINKHGTMKYNCRCECGTTKSIVKNALLNGETKQCKRCYIRSRRNMVSNSCS